MSIWFTSDEHLGHHNIIGFCNRPFSDLSDMTEGLVARHNSVVEPGDLVYHLGDMFWRTFPLELAQDVMNNLKGQHYYIRGNHEEFMDKYPTFTNSRFIWVKERANIKPEGGPKSGIVLDHFAGRVWNHSGKGSWQLYGHSHGELPESDSLLAMDVGVDANDYYPVSLEQVRAHMEEKMKGMQRKIGGLKQELDIPEKINKALQIAQRMIDSSSEAGHYPSEGRRAAL